MILGARGGHISVRLCLILFQRAPGVQLRSELTQTYRQAHHLSDHSLRFRVEAQRGHA